MSDDQARPHLFRDLTYYMFRWVAFAVVMAGLQPVYNPGDQFWILKAKQALSGIPFGIAACLLFTPLQNSANPLRSRLKFWPIAIVSWLAPVLAFTFAFSQA
jgi:hypothetical protein